MPVRTLHISGGNLYGGVETILTTLAREEKNHPSIQNHFALCFEGRLSEELRVLGAPLTILGAVRARYPWTVLRARSVLLNFLRQTKQPFDAIICHMPWNLAIFGPVVKRYEKCPLFFWLHDVLSKNNWVERWASLTTPQLIICNSEFTSRTVDSLFSEVPKRILYPPVSNQAARRTETKRNELRVALKTPRDSCVVIQVSRMEPYKGHSLHLEALSRVPGNWVCWIVGGPQRPHEKLYFDDLQTLAQKLEIADKVRFLGNRQDVPDLLAAADIFCQPNIREEPFGLVFIEALYAGMPVISTNMGGAQEIIEPRCGRLVPPGDVFALTNALQTLMRDESMRKALGAAGPERAKSLCDPEQVIHTLATIVNARKPVP